MPLIRIKRAYDAPSKGEGVRILVDRLWPRGLTKEKLKVDLWLRDIAPSEELRRWFSHDVRKWQGFRKKYAGELKGKRELIQKVKQAEKERRVVTLVYSAKDEEHNQAVVLLEVLRGT